jgi:RHS repeat-associated protein
MRGVTLYGRGEAVAVSYSDSTGSRSMYLGKDVMGSVRATTSASGELEERYEYDAFGKPYKGDLSGGMNLGYTGKPYDAATGLYNYGFRDYKPQAARFTTVDPIRDGNNWYAYVNNDPVNWLDLWGLEASDVRGSWFQIGQDTSGQNFIGSMTQAANQNTITPLTQNSPELSGITNMAAFGCYFRSSQAVAEFEVGVALTAEQIQASVTALQNTPNTANPGTMVIDGNFIVNNPDAVINDAFSRLGQPDLTGTVGWGGTAGEQDYIIQMGSVSTTSSHYTLHDGSGNLLFDPYPGLIINNPTNLNVFIHGN